MGGPETISGPPISNDQFFRQMFGVEKVVGTVSAGRSAGNNSKRLKKRRRFRHLDFPRHRETVIVVGGNRPLRRGSELKAHSVAHGFPATRKN